MEKNLFREVYKLVCGLALKDCPPSSLSGLLHGYLSVYSMVRVYPWLEDEYGSLWDIHDRIREIARVVQELLKDKDLPVDTRAGYVVDLMDAYLLYSDMKFVDTALDTAYEILIPKGSDKIVVPCRTPNICRLLCNCYYFTGDAECGVLVDKMVREALGYVRGGECDDWVGWWNIICLYDDVSGMMGFSIEERTQLSEEKIRLIVRVKQKEKKMVEFFQREGTDLDLIADVFNILAKQEFEVYNELCSKKE